MADERAQALIEWIHSARTFGEKVGLSNMLALTEALGHPEKNLRCVHVAGTNGKGSVCAMLERVLREAGYHTGLYTSPYLIRYNERVRLDGVPIDDQRLIACGQRVRLAAEALARAGVKPTAFELGTALAFCAFDEAKVDVAVIETGLGGRLDPTNVLKPIVCAITTIGLDHVEILGGTLPEIAREKAGIFKPGAPVALYPQPGTVMAVFDEVARARGVELRLSGDYPIEALHQDAYGARFTLTLPEFGEMAVRVPLPGLHQALNARLALATLGLISRQGFAVSRKAAEEGIARTVWPGRLEWLGGALLDGAHNPEGARALAEYLRAFFGGRDIVLLTGMMRDKQPEICADILSAHCAKVVATQVAWPRALPAEALAQIYRARGVDAEAVADATAALARAREIAGEGALLVVAGSLYLVGAVRAEILGEG
ncbi:MAG: folylpolyglutamate synthase/dihydrofolate synthase family protein [Clostridia bacterium]